MQADEHSTVPPGACDLHLLRGVSSGFTFLIWLSLVEHQYQFSWFEHSGCLWTLRPSLLDHCRHLLACFPISRPSLSEHSPSNALILYWLWSSSQETRGGNRFAVGSLFWGVPSKSTLTGSAGGRTGQREELNGDAATSRPRLIPLFQGELSSCLSEWSQMEAWGMGFCTYPQSKQPVIDWMQLQWGKGMKRGNRALGEVRCLSLAEGNSLKWTHPRAFPGLHVTCREWVFRLEIGSGRHTTCSLQFTGKEVRIVSTCDSSPEQHCGAGCFP